MRAFRILYEDELLLAVDKPAGFHSHPPEDKSIRLNHHWNALSVLQKQTGLKLYPAHRLDRATSGILLLSKEREQNAALQRQFLDQAVEKTYLCLVRGEYRGSGTIDLPLKTDSGTEDAKTHTEALAGFQLPIQGPKGERRFTILIARPVTGRYHQIRRHLNQSAFPIVGDSRHGDRKLNREFAALTGKSRMFLRCVKLRLTHPGTGKSLGIKAPFTGDWQALFDRAGQCPLL